MSLSGTFLAVQPVHLRQHTRAARARKSADMVSAIMVSSLPIFSVGGLTVQFDIGELLLFTVLYSALQIHGTRKNNLCLPEDMILRGLWFLPTWFPPTWFPWP